MATRRKRQLGAWVREHLMKRANIPPCSGSNPFGETDRRAAAEPNRRIEQRISGRTLCSGGQRRLAVVALVGAELLDHSGKLGIVAVPFEPVDLAGVMAVDFLLDRGGAGHCRFGPNQRGSGAERIARSGPYRLQRG